MMCIWSVFQEAPIMLELGVGADLLRSIGWLYLAVAVVAAALAMRSAKSTRGKIFSAAVVLAAFGFLPVTNYFQAKAQAEAYKQKYDAAAAIFKKLCETAGDKIYKTVENVDGIRLTKMFSTEDRTTDPAWEAAAFAKAFAGPDYISSLLWFEEIRSPPDARRRGSLTSTPTPVSGFRFVEVPTSDPGKFDQYSLKYDDEYKRLRPFKEAGRPSSARYSVSIEDLPQHRDLKNWIAGGLIQIRDIQSSEVIAEHRRFAFDPALGSTAGQRQQWLFADACPIPAVRPFEVRFFADQVIKPSKEYSK